jgi:hypothetical protein
VLKIIAKNVMVHHYVNIKEKDADVKIVVEVKYVFTKKIKQNALIVVEVKFVVI